MQKNKEASQTSKVKRFLNQFLQSTIVDVWQGSEYASRATKLEFRVGYYKMSLSDIKSSEIS